MNVPAASEIAAAIKDSRAETPAWIARHRELILRLRAARERASALERGPKGAVQIVVDERDACS